MRNRALPADTSVEAARVQIAGWQRLGMARRLLIATELSENMRRISESGVQHRHPEYSADQVRLGAIRLRIGEALFRRAYPHSNELP